MPFAPDVTEAEDPHLELANQLQKLITEQATEGWKFVRIESTNIVIPSASQGGCFSLISPAGGGGTLTRFDVAVFEK
jgi:hypothetical protein